MIAIRRSLRALAERLRVAWLPLTLALAAALLVAINTLVLPAAAPALAWGPPRPGRAPFGSGPSVDRLHVLVSGDAPRPFSPFSPDQGQGRISARDVQRALKLQRSAGTPGEFVVAAPPGGRADPSWNRSNGDVQVVALPGRGTPGLPAQELAANVGPTPVPTAPPAPASFLVPLGLHRPGVEGLGLYALSLVSFAAVTALLVLLLPARFRTARDALMTGLPFKALAVGALAYVLAALLSLFLVMLVVGSPLASLIMGVTLLLGLAGLVTVTLAVGRLLVQRSGAGVGSAPLELATGVLALFVAASIPYLGWPLVLTASSAGLGSLIMTRFGSGEPWSLRPLEEG